MLGLLGELAATAPLVVMLEDLHWADTSSREMMSFLAVRLADAEIVDVVAGLLPVTARAGHAQPLIPTLNEARNLEHVFAALPKGLHEVILVDGHSTDGLAVDVVAGRSAAVMPGCGREVASRASASHAPSVSAGNDRVLLAANTGAGNTR